MRQQNVPHKLRQKLGESFKHERDARSRISTDKAVRGVVGLGMLLHGKLWEDRYVRSSDAEFFCVRDFPAGQMSGALRNQCVHLASSARMELRNRVPWLAFDESPIDRRWALNFTPVDEWGDGYNIQRRDTLDVERFPRETVLLGQVMADMTDAAFRGKDQYGFMNTHYANQRKNAPYDLPSPSTTLPRVLLGFPANRGFAGIFHGATADEGSVEYVCPHCQHTLDAEVTVFSDDVVTCAVCRALVSAAESVRIPRLYSAGFVRRMFADWKQGLQIRLPVACKYTREEVIPYRQSNGEVVEISHHRFVSATGQAFTISLPSWCVVSNETEFDRGAVFANKVAAQFAPLPDAYAGVESMLQAMQRTAGIEFQFLAMAWFSGQLFMPVWDKKHYYVPADLLPAGKLPDIEADQLLLDMDAAIAAGCRWESEYGFQVNGFIFPPVRAPKGNYFFELPESTSDRSPGVIQLDARLGGSNRQQTVSTHCTFAEGPAPQVLTKVVAAECEAARIDLAAAWHT